LITRAGHRGENSEPASRLEREVGVRDGWRQFVRKRVDDVSTVAFEQT
jgi:hypothetical protein